MSEKSTTVFATPTVTVKNIYDAEKGGTPPESKEKAETKITKSTPQKANNKSSDLKPIDPAFAQHLRTYVETGRVPSVPEAKKGNPSNEDDFQKSAKQIEVSSLDILDLGMGPIRPDTKITTTDINGTTSTTTAKELIHKDNVSKGITSEDRQEQRDLLFVQDSISKYYDTAEGQHSDEELDKKKQVVNYRIEQYKKNNPEAYEENKEMFDSALGNLYPDFRKGASLYSQLVSNIDLYNTRKSQGASEDNTKKAREAAWANIESMKRDAPEYYAKNAAELYAMYAGTLSAEEIDKLWSELSQDVYDSIWTPELQAEYDRFTAESDGFDGFWQSFFAEQNTTYNPISPTDDAKTAAEKRRTQLSSIRADASDAKNNFEYDLSRIREIAVYTDAYGHGWIAPEIDLEKVDKKIISKITEDILFNVAYLDNPTVAPEMLNYSESYKKAKNGESTVIDLKAAFNLSKIDELKESSESFNNHLARLVMMYEQGDKLSLPESGKSIFGRYRNDFLESEVAAISRKKILDEYADVMKNGSAFQKFGKMAEGFVGSFVLTPYALGEGLTAVVTAPDIDGYKINTDYDLYSSNKRGVDEGRTNIGVSMATNTFGNEDIGKFVFNLGDGIATNFVNGLTGPGNMFFSGMQVLQSEIDAGIQNKENVSEFFPKAVIAAGAESIGELVQFKGLERVLDTLSTEKHFFKRVFKGATLSGANEVPSELTTEAINIISDILISGEDSEYNRAILEMIASGEASGEYEAALKYFGKRGFDTAVTAYLSGAFLGGSSSVFSYDKNSTKSLEDLGSRIKNGEGNVNILIEQARASKNKETVSLANKKSLSDLDVGRLYDMALADTQNGDLDLEGFATGQMYLEAARKIMSEGRVEDLVEVAKLSSNSQTIYLAEAVEEHLKDGGRTGDANVAKLYQAVATDLTIEVEKIAAFGRGEKVIPNVETAAESAIDTAIGEVARANTGTGEKSAKNTVNVVKNDGTVVTANGEKKGKLGDSRVYIVKGSDIGESGFYAVKADDGKIVASGETKSVVLERLREARKQYAERGSADADVRTELETKTETVETADKSAGRVSEAPGARSIVDIIRNIGETVTTKKADGEGNVEVRDGEKVSVTRRGASNISDVSGTVVGKDTGYSLAAVEVVDNKGNKRTVIIERTSGLEFASGANVEEALANTQNKIDTVGRDKIDATIAQYALSNGKAKSTVDVGSTSVVKGDTLSVGRAVSEANYINTLLEKAKTSGNEKIRKAAALYESFDFKNDEQRYRAIGDIAKRLGITEGDLVKSRARYLYAKITTAISDEGNILDRINSGIESERLAAKNRGDTATIKALDYLKKVIDTEGSVISASEIFAANEYTAENRNIAVEVYGKRMEAAFKKAGLDISVSVYYDSSDNAPRGEWTKFPDGHSEIRLNGAKLDGEQSAFWTLSHELLHEAESNSPGITQRMLDAFTKMGMYSEEQYEAYKARYNAVCEAEFKRKLDRGNVTQEDHDEFVRNYVNEEIVADLMGETMGSTDLIEVFAGKLGKDDSNVIVSFLKWLKNGIKKVFNSKDEFPNKFADIIGMFEGAVKNGVDKASDAGYNNTRYKLVKTDGVDVFPPYNESGSDTNERATRWAHKRDIEDYTQRFFYHEGIRYLVEKDSSLSLGYRVLKKVTNKEFELWRELYNEGDFENGENSYKEQRNVRTVQDNEAIGRKAESFKRGSGYGAISDKHNGKASGTQGMGSEQNAERRTNVERERASERGVENTQGEVKKKFALSSTVEKTPELITELEKAVKNKGVKDFQSTETRNAVSGNNSITQKAIEALRSIGRKSVNAFTSEDIKKAEPFARRMWQELGVKSTFFRAWFGDWRVFDKNTVSTEIKKGDTRGEVKNSDTDWNIIISRQIHKETSHHGSNIAKNAVKYLPYIKSITENAVLFDSYISDKDNPLSVMYHKLYAYTEEFGYPALLKLTVEELVDEKTGNPIRRDYILHNIEEESISKRNRLSTPNHNENGSSVISISELFNLVKTYDKEFSYKEPSGVVNGDGTPKIMYHGSPEQFTIFDKKKAESSGAYGKGFYFTDSDSHAKQYGNLYAVYLDVKNPLKQGESKVTESQIQKYLEAVAENEDYSIENYGTYDVSEIMKKIESRDAFAVIQDINATAIGDMVEAAKLWNAVNGTSFDGIVAPTETVVFEPTQVKSATDNIGTFDRGNPDTRFALSGKKVDNENTRAARYTDQEYHAYGWARENDIITKGENEDYRSKFAALKSGMAKYPQTKRGEYIIPAYDLNVPEFENIDNVLVYVKGTIDKPKITSIIRIYSYNETEIDKIRRYIYDCERRGVQPKTGELFDRYDAADFAVRPQISASSSGYSSRDGLYGSGSSSKNNGIDKRRLAGLDSEYLELAKNPEKNEARLREIVEEAAKVAMPDSKVIDSDGNMKNVFHGTSKGGHTQFDTYDYYSKFGLFGNGAYFTEDKVIAEQYTKKGRGNNPQVYSVFLNITNPIDMDAKADIEAWNKALQKTGEDFSLLDGDMTNEQAFKRMVEDLEYAEVYSYDAAEIVRNVFENMGYNGITHIGGGRGGQGDGTKHRVWIAFEPKQIKSADPVTYDDNGNVIPISERFNSGKSDIRYSLPGTPYGLTIEDDSGTIDNNAADGGVKNGNTGRNAEVVRELDSDSKEVSGHTEQGRNIPIGRRYSENDYRNSEQEIRYKELSAYEKSRVNEILYKTIDESDNLRFAFSNKTISEATERLCEIIESDSNALQAILDEVPEFANAIDETFRFLNRNRGDYNGDTGRNAETLRVRGENYHVYKSETSNQGSRENSTQYNAKKIRHQGLSAYEKGRLNEILYPVVEEAEDFKYALKELTISEATARLCEIIDSEPDGLQYMIEAVPGFAEAVDETFRFLNRNRGDYNGNTGRDDGKIQNISPGNGRILSQEINNGEREDGYRNGKYQIRYQDLSAYEKSRVSEILYETIEKSDVWRFSISNLTISEATEKLYNMIESDSPVIREIIDDIPEFADAVEKSIRFVNRNKVTSQSGKNVSGDASPSGAFDSNGNELSKAQNEMFKDSKARDKDGKLLALYHGSRFSDVHEFDVYKGVWLTPDIEYAKSFSDFEDANIHSLYANITNPADIGQINGKLTTQKLGELADALGVERRTVLLAAKSYLGGKVFDFTRSVEFIDIAREAGFDGLKALEGDVETYCIISNGNQIKETANIMPSSDTDTRYSLADTGIYSLEDANKFTYDSLVSLPDMEVAKVSDAIPKKADGKLDRAKVKFDAMNNAFSVGEKVNGSLALVGNRYTGKKIAVRPSAIGHGLDRRTNVAIVSGKIGELLQNAVRVNEMSSRDNMANVNKSYPMIAVASDESGAKYAVLLIVNDVAGRNPELVELNVSEALYSVNAKKEESAVHSTRGPDAKNAEQSLTDSNISIADLLSFVKDYFPDVLSDDVLSRFGMIKSGNSAYEGVRYSLADTGIYSLEDAWAEKVEKYGAIPKGEKAARDVKVPKKISENQYVSRTARSAIEAGITPAEFVPELQKEILDGKFTYERFPDEKAEAKAKETIEYHGFEGALEHWDFLMHSGGAISKENFALGIALYNQCAQNGDFKNAEKILADLAAEATRAGQAIQSMRLLKKMSADGTMYYLEKSIEKINDELVQKFGDRAKKVEINEELANRYFAEKDEKKRSKLYDELCKDIGQQIPSTFWEKADAWRYLSMLLNPTTHIRNIGGNILNKFVIMADHVVEGALQPIFVKRENRTRTWRIADKKAADFAKNDWEAMKDVLTSGEGKYNNMMSDIDQNRRIFTPTKDSGKAKKAVGNAFGYVPEVLRKLNSWGLEAEDAVFLGKSYRSAMRKIITARKLDVAGITPEQLSEIRELATKDALRATFREANWLAEGISRAKSNLMKGNAGQKAAGIALGGLFPFTKTPMNITKQALEHSPLGVFKVTSDIVKKASGKAVSGNDIIADLARTFTGTGLTVLGFVLARAGFVSAGDDEDKEKKNFDKLVGKQSYAITIGGKSYTIDWATPASIPFLVGAQFADETEDSGVNIKTSIDALTKIAEPVVGLSMLDGLRDFLQSDNYAEGQNPLFAGAYSTIESYIMQFFPTLGGKFKRIVDGEKKNYYFVDKNSSVPEFVQELYGSVASKLPFAVGNFQPSVDLWGRVENHGGIGERLAENLISPGYYSEENYTEVDEELLRLYESTGNGDVFPKKMYEDITIDGHKYYMNAEHYTEAAIMLGERRFDMLSRLFNDEIVLEKQDVPYSELSDSEKAKIVSDVYYQALDETKYAMFDKVRENSAKYGDIPELDYFGVLDFAKEKSGIIFAGNPSGENGMIEVYWSQRYNFADQALKAIEKGDSSKAEAYKKDLEKISEAYDGQLSRGDELIADIYDKTEGKKNSSGKVTKLLYTESESYILTKSKNNVSYDMPMSYHDYKAMTKYMNDAGEFAALYVLGNDSDKSSASKLRNQNGNMKSWVADGLKAASSAMMGNYELYKSGKLSVDEYNAIYYKTLVGKIKSEIRASYRESYFEKLK